MDAQHFSPNLGLKLFTSNIEAWTSPTDSPQPDFFTQKLIRKTIHSPFLQPMRSECFLLTRAPLVSEIRKWRGFFFMLVETNYKKGRKEGEKEGGREGEKEKREEEKKRGGSRENTLAARGLEELFFPVVLLCQFLVLVGNRFWFYLLCTYVLRVQYSFGVVLVFDSGGK
jgi:hypothetical protein